LATLLRFTFGQEVSEPKVLEILKRNKTDGEWENALNQGFSMLDLKSAAEQLGMSAAGYQLTLPILQSSRVPLIVHLKKDGYQHFAVFIASSEGFYILSDPAQGLVKYSKNQFVGQWTGFALAIWPRGQGNLPPQQNLEELLFPSYGVRNALNYQHPFWQGIR
jgi:predicted double-glycine peptidase